LKVGDIITHADGQPVEASEEHDGSVFETMIRAFKITAQPELSVIRDDAPLKIKTSLSAAPAKENEQSTFEDTAFELKARDLTHNDRVNRKLNEAFKGALLMEVQMGGWAAVSGLKSGDIVLSINNETVTNAADLEGKLKAAVEKKSKYVVFFVRRGINTSFVEVFPVWNEKK
jgi:S1-C subfamily serine protease